MSGDFPLLSLFHHHNCYIHFLNRVFITVDSTVKSFRSLFLHLTTLSLLDQCRRRVNRSALSILPLAVVLHQVARTMGSFLNIIFLFSAIVNALPYDPVEEPWKYVQIYLVPKNSRRPFVNITLV